MTRARAGSAAGWVPRDDRWRGAELAFWSLPLVGYFVFPEYLVLGSQLLIAGIFVLSLDLILGYAGIVSLGHAAYFGVGAYTAGLLGAHGFGEPLSGLVLSALVSGGVGCLTSFLVVGGHGLQQLMVTLGVGFLFHEAANQASSITGGMDGLSGVDMWELLGAFDFDLSGRAAYVYSGLVLFGCFFVARRLVHSPFGLSLEAIRENARRMPAIGVPVRRRLIAVYTLAAALAGIAGALTAQTTEFVGLEVLSFERSASALVMLVLGGTGRLYGALLGTCLFMLLQTFLSGINPVYWQFWIGLCVVLMAFFARRGLLGIGASARAAFGAALRSRPRADARPGP